MGDGSRRSRCSLQDDEGVVSNSVRTRGKLSPFQKNNDRLLWILAFARMTMSVRAFALEHDLEGLEDKLEVVGQLAATADVVVV